MKSETKKLIEIYLDRFVNRRDVIPLQKMINGDFSYFPWWCNATANIYLDLLEDRNGYGFYALNKDNHGRWLGFDDDTDSPDGLPKLTEFLKLHSWNFLLEGARTGRNGHCWLLFDKPVPGYALRILGETMLRQSGAKPMEIFPKQAVIGKVGSLLRAPLSVHLKSGQRGLFSDCADKSIKGQLQWLSKQSLNSAAKAMRLAHEHRPLPKPVYLKRRTYSSNRIDFIDYAYDNGFSIDGDYMRGTCPLCTSENHDMTGDHFWVNIKTDAAGCWRCGKDRFKEICRVIRTGHNAA